MKIVALTAIMLAAGSLAAGSEGSVSGYRVIVCSTSEPGTWPGNAHLLTKRMFADIGVKLEWLYTGRCPAGALQISLLSPTPSGLQPGALGYAMPGEGTHIVIFLDRVQAQPSGNSARVLAHVMAHEITHILQGFGRHSLTGLMKAHWEPKDLRDMRSETLPFTREDVDLIYQGLERRQKGTAVGTLPGQCHNGGTEGGPR
jgi:hypothetical protein